MKRKLFTVTAMMSLLLFALTAVLWVRGRWTQDRLLITQSTRTWDIANVDGALRISHVSDWPDRPPSPDQSPGFRTFHDSGERVLGDGDLSIEDAAITQGWHWLGITICPSEVSDRPSMSFATFYIIPWWALVAITGMGAIPLIWLQPIASLRRWYRGRRLGHCPACSYNLTANVSGVCPECGTPVPKKANATT
jgi:hypothetical protein